MTPVGYLPTREAYEQGGYEVTPGATAYAPGCAEKLAESATRQLEGVVWASRNQRGWRIEDRGWKDSPCRLRGRRREFARPTKIVMDSRTTGLAQRQRGWGEGAGRRLWSGQEPDVVETSRDGGGAEVGDGHNPASSGDARYYGVPGAGRQAFTGVNGVMSGVLRREAKQHVGPLHLDLCDFSTGFNRKPCRTPS